MGPSRYWQNQQSTTLSSSIPEVSLVIYDLNVDRRKPSLAEERRRLLNTCRLFGIPIALDVETVPENGGIGIRGAVGLFLDQQAYSHLSMHSYRQRCSRNWITRRYPTLGIISDCKLRHPIIHQAVYRSSVFCHSNLLPHPYITP